MALVTADVRRLMYAEQRPLPRVSYWLKVHVVILQVVDRNGIEPCKFCTDCHSGPSGNWSAVIFDLKLKLACNVPVKLLCVNVHG